MPGMSCPCCGSMVPADTALPSSATQAGKEPNLFAPTVELPRSAVSTIDHFARGPLLALPEFTFSNYILGDRIGYGGMGVVYLALHKKLKCKIALKVIQVGGMYSDVYRSRFNNEAAAIARVVHPHVVRVYDAGEENGYPYLAMEYAAHGTLSERVKARGVLAPLVAARMMAGVARGVHAVNVAGVVHRDIKPSNILLDENDSPKVADFGLARLADGDGQTRSGAILGTPSYMAPEQCRGAKVIGPAADVYALGGTLFFTLVGKSPFPEAASAGAVTRSDYVPGPRDINPELSPTLDAIVRKCLSLNEADRYASAEALADDLGRWERGEPLEAQVPSLATKVLAKAKPYRWPALAALVLLAAGLGVGLAIRPAAASIDDATESIDAAYAQKLLAGKSVELIPAAGLPERPAHWLLNEVKLTLSTAGDKTCGFQTHATSLLTLISDPQLDRYRLTVELRHVENADDGAAVGVFLGHASLPWPGQEAADHFIGLELCDLEKSVALQRVGRCMIRDFWFLHESEKNLTHTIQIQKYPFTSNNTQPTLWRTVRFDVTPEGILVEWQLPDKTWASIATITAEDMAKTVETHKMTWPTNFPGTRLPPMPTWKPRLPLGVYGRNVSAAFRNARLEPLPRP